MKGSLVKFLFVCSTFLETFCKGSKREGVKFKYDLPGDLPMDAKQNAWTTVKENGDGKKAEIKYKVTETPYYSRLRNKCRGTLINFWSFFQWLRAY